MSDNLREHVVIIGGGRRGIVILETLNDDEEVGLLV